MDASKLNWPADLRPEDVPVYTYNEILIPADAERIWAWLIRAASWPSWYANCRNLEFLTGSGPDLAPGALFAWTTFGVRVKTAVQEFLPLQRLAWRGTAPGGEAYHGWLILPQSGGCRVITEETQKGMVPSIGRFFLRRGLLREHQKWLEGLSRMSRGGPPSAAPCT